MVKYEGLGRPRTSPLKTAKGQGKVGKTSKLLSFTNLGKFTQFLNK